MVRHNNNFDLLRLSAAVTVIFSHAVLLAEGNLAKDPLAALTDGRTPLGLAGVFVFFTISGYLVTQSFEATGSPLRYLIKRALRIAPGLFVCTVMTAFVIGPLITTLPLRNYLGDFHVYGSVVDGWTLGVGKALVHADYRYLPGVQYVVYPEGKIVNGSLWSLAPEVMMYVMVFVLGVLRLLVVPVAMLLVLAGMLGIVFDTSQSGLGHFAWLLSFFGVGITLYLLRANRILRPALALLAVFGLVLGILLHQFMLFFAIFGSYLTIYLAFCGWLPVVPAARFGDLSYGLYIYGWPVEGCVSHFIGGAPGSWLQVFALSLLICVPLAWLSWNLAEKPALRMKPRSVRSETLAFGIPSSPMPP